MAYSIKTQCFDLHSNFLVIFLNIIQAVCALGTLYMHMQYKEIILFKCLLGLHPCFCSTCLKHSSLLYPAIERSLLIIFFMLHDCWCLYLLLNYTCIIYIHVSFFPQGFELFESYDYVFFTSGLEKGVVCGKLPGPK